jgi:hypothetical protein
VGEISVQDLIEHQKRLIEDPDFVTGFNTLTDFTHARPAASVNYDKVNFSRDFVESIQNIRGECKWAFIAPSDVTYGICRMFQILSEDLIIETRVFRTEDEAKEWLQI